MRNEKYKNNGEIKHKRENYIFRESRAITLISLVITIILLIILAGIAINISIKNNGIFMRAKQAKNETEKVSLIEQIQTEIIYKQLENEGTEIDKKDLEDILKKYGEVKKDGQGNITGIKPEGKPEISIKDIMGNNKVTEAGKLPVISDVSGANKPSGQIANKEYVTWEWNASTNLYEETLSKEQPDNWYDYENGKWANIKTTKVNTNEDGTTETLEAYWVWVPRYEYIVPTSTTATEIAVRFIGTEIKEGTEGYTAQSDGTIQSSDGYTIHPAFTWKERQTDGTYKVKELPGIWVAKYEAVSSTPTASNGGGNTASLKVQVIPNKPSWRAITTNNIFAVCRKMTSEGEVLAGSIVDSHMMKNIEWGAVAILSQSKYGIFNPKSSTGDGTTENGVAGDGTHQVWNNPNNSCITGSVGTSKDASDQSSTNVYNSSNGPKASTTGTVYGVYGMAGGSLKYVAGCLNGQENGKFGVMVGDSTYVDLYTNSSNSGSNYDGAHTGDATKETKRWNSDNASFVISKYPVFLRGRWLQHGHSCGSVSIRLPRSGVPIMAIVSMWSSSHK